MKKLESLLGGKFVPLGDLEMLKIIGKEKPTLENRATMQKLGGGCQQADKYTNDKLTLVGDVICVPDTIRRDTIFGMSQEEPLPFEETTDMIEN